MYYVADMRTFAGYGNKKNHDIVPDTGRGGNKMRNSDEVKKWIHRDAGK